MTSADVSALARVLPPEQIVTNPSQLESLSRDFYWYSPVLKRELSSRVADAVVQPHSEEQLRDIIRFAFQHRIPLTIRGAGTGNYGQCIPTQGGLVVDLAYFDKVLEVTSEGIARCEPAARLASIRSKPSHIQQLIAIIIPGSQVHDRKSFICKLPGPVDETYFRRSCSDIDF